ncbi:ferritin heavy chain-like [Danaus plexippus]|nr:ferritin heavy chain-like [Danaus plexippus]
MIYKTFLKSSKRLIVFISHSNCQPYIHVRRNHAIEHSSKLERAFNKQIKSEHEASLVYLKLAINFLHPCVSRKGFGGYFISLHKEELLHMHTLIQYQLVRGFHPLIEDVKSPKIQGNISVCQAFDLAIQLESDVTASLKGLIQLADSEGDRHCADFITSTFLQEQIQSTNELWHHLTNLKRMNDNEHALYHYDKQLSKKFAYDIKGMNLRN